MTGTVFGKNGKTSEPFQKVTYMTNTVGTHCVNDGVGDGMEQEMERPETRSHGRISQTVFAMGLHGPLKTSTQLSQVSKQTLNTEEF